MKTPHLNWNNLNVRCIAKRIYLADEELAKRTEELNK